MKTKTTYKFVILPNVGPSLRPKDFVDEADYQSCP